MKKISLMLLSILLTCLFLIGCQKETEISDEDLKAELENMSVEELNKLSEGVENVNLAGQAYYQMKSFRISPKRIQTFLKAMKYSAKVYKVSDELTPQTTVVYLKHLKGDGTLQGKRIQVINHCSETPTTPGYIPIAQVYSPSNIFFYNPITQGTKFDQANVYYYGEFSLDYFAKFSKHIGWSQGNVLEIPIIKIELCHPSLGPSNDGFKGGTFYADSNTLALSCYSSITCANIGKTLSPEKEDKIENEARKLGTIMHEFTHGIYVPIAKNSGVAATSGQWNQLNEAYANFIPRAAINSVPGVFSSEGEFGNLDNSKQFNYNSYDGLNVKNILAISGALWDVSEEIGAELTNELVIRSWKILHNFKNNSPPVAALIALIDSSKQKYGATSQTHKNNREKIVNAFANHGIVCETCFPAG